MNDFAQGLVAASSMQDLQLAAGLGAMFDSFDHGLGAFDQGSTKYVTTKDQGRLGSTFIQPTSGDVTAGTYDSRKKTAIGYFPKNSAVKVSGMTSGVATQVTGNAWSMGLEAGGVDEPLGMITGWVNNTFLSDTQGGTPWVPPGGKPSGPIEPVSEKKETVTETDYTPWILGGAAVLGLGIIGWAVMAKPKGGVQRAGRRRTGMRRRRGMRRR